MTSPIPVTILSGFLGAGKTTLLRYLLKAEHGLKIAVIENEFSDAGIDTQLLGDEPVQVMTLANGCVCCTIHTDLTKALYLLLERRYCLVGQRLGQRCSTAQPMGQQGFRRQQKGGGTRLAGGKGARQLLRQCGAAGVDAHLEPLLHHRNMHPRRVPG